MEYGGMFFSFYLPVPRSQGTWGTRDSEWLNLRCLKDSGTKIMAFQCEGHRCEWCFLRTRVQFRPIRPKLRWRWTAIANILARSVLSVNLQSHAVQNFLLPGTRSAHLSLASTPNLAADSKSYSIQCALFCIVSHEILTALATRNFKKR